MIRRKSGLKEVTWLMLASAALISVACGDDDDDLYGNTGGTSGSSAAGKGSGGSSTAGKGSGGSSAGSTAGGTTAGGSTTGGTAGTTSEGGEPSGGTTSEGGTDGEGGEATGGVPSAGAGGEGGAPFVADTLDNPGFEQGTANSSTFPGWTNEGTPGAAFVQFTDSHSGTGRLGHWTKWESNESPPYTARTYQTVSPIANGTYSFSMWVDRGWFDEQYLYATGYDAEDLEDEVTVSTDDAETPAGYVKITLSNIVVTSGSITVGVYSAAPAGTYTNFDDAELTLVE